MNKISKILVLLLASFAFAQPPGELLPIFPAPLDDVLAPWPDIERVDDALCWPDEPPPFIGAAYTFMCFHSPLSQRHLSTGLSAAFDDAGYWMNHIPVPFDGAWPSLGFMPGEDNRVNYYVFEHAEVGTLFSVAAAF